MKLLLNAFIKFLLGILMIGLLLFLPAGTFKFWNGWLLMGLLFIPMFLVMIGLFLKNKSLLEKRINGKEKESTQKLVILFTLIIFIVSFVVAGLDFRYNFSRLPNIVVGIGSVILVLSYLLYVEVLRENTFLSRSVEVQKDQKIIDTGLYGLVRHPMYMATTLLYLSFPLVLGSLISFLLFLPFPFLLVIRIKNEEKVLEKGLKGYKDYQKKVKYRMIPFIW